MNEKRFYLKHGNMPDSDHDTLKQARGKAYDIIAHFGDKHSQIKIEDRKRDIVVLIYDKTALFIRQGEAQ